MLGRVRARTLSTRTLHPSDVVGGTAALAAVASLKADALDPTADAAESPSVCVWLEMSNVNHPAMAAYRRLGVHLCGLDATLHCATPWHDEVALFFVRPL